MSKFKHAALALAAASLVTVSAHADDAQTQSPQVVSLATFSQTDLNKLFEQSGKPIQLAALSGQEMKETEGAWVWIYFYAPQIAFVTNWMANTGWRTIPSWFHNVRQRW
jgi:hypothetical protein